MTKLEDLHFNGIAMDTTCAEINFKIFDKIKAVWDRINELDHEDQMLLIYIRDCAKEKTILHLGRLYDRKSIDYDTRCLEEIIDFIQSNKLPISRHFLTDKKWQEFQLEHSIVFESFKSETELNPENFIEKLNELLNQLKTKNEKTVLNTLKNWRDKRLAHNEKTNEKILLEHDEIKLLIQIPKSVLDFINDFMSTGTHFVYEIDKHTYFIDHLLKRIQVTSNKQKRQNDYI